MCVDVGACDCTWGYPNTARKSAMKAGGGGGGGLTAPGNPSHIDLGIDFFLGGGGRSTEGYTHSKFCCNRNYLH